MEATPDAPTDAEAGPVEAEAATCDGTGLPGTSTCVIAETFGVFVSPTGSDADSGTGGTRANPLRSLARAIQVAKAQGKRVYACDDGTGYSDGVTIGPLLDGVSLFGGFACGDWSYSTTRRAVVRSATVPVLAISGSLLGGRLRRRSKFVGGTISVALEDCSVATVFAKSR